jgi:hypothetical protein
MIDKPLVIYAHIPKTGGTSATNVFHRVYGAERFFRVTEGQNEENQAVAQALLLNEPFKYDVISVHLGQLNLHTLPSQRPMRYFTILRHPVNRIVSLYRYIRSEEKHHRHEKFKELDSLEAALPMMGANLQTRLVAGLPPKQHPVDADLEQAKRNLDDLFLFTGILERFNETLLLLKGMLGWTQTFVQPPHLNTTSKNKTLPPSLYQQVLDRNTLDMALYEYGNQLLDRKIKEMGFAFQRDKINLTFRRSIRQAKALVRGQLRKK